MCIYIYAHIYVYMYIYVPELRVRAPLPWVTSLCPSSWPGLPYETPGSRSCQVLWALAMLTDAGEVWLEQA